MKQLHLYLPEEVQRDYLKRINYYYQIILIACSIYIAKINKFIDDVYVSTDSKEIEKIAIDYGAKDIVRPFELAQDNAPEFLSWNMP